MYSTSDKRIETHSKIQILNDFKSRTLMTILFRAKGA